MNTIHLQDLEAIKLNFDKVRLFPTKSSNFNFIHKIEFHDLSYH